MEFNHLKRMYVQFYGIKKTTQLMDSNKIMFAEKQKRCESFETSIPIMYENVTRFDMNIYIVEFKSI